MYANIPELSFEEKQKAWEWRHEKRLKASKKDIHFIAAMNKLFNHD